MLTIEENVSLAGWNTFLLPAIAERLLITKDEVSLLQALREEQPYFILGGGSNIVLPAYLPGLTLKIEVQGIEVVNESQTEIWLRVGAGSNWHELVGYSAAQGWGGIENLALIPGTVGAAPMQNIGAYGMEVGDSIENVEVVELATGIPKTLSHAACHFGYRESIFKTEGKGKYCITAVTFRLAKQPIYKLSYGELAIAFEGRDPEQLHPTEIVEAVSAIRRRKLPNPAELPNAGSFFKNPIVSLQHFEALQERGFSPPAYPTDNIDMVKLSAGWLIEACGWKGKRVGAFGVAPRHALVLVHYGGGEAQGLSNLATAIALSVYEEFGVELSPEVNFIT